MEEQKRVKETKKKVPDASSSSPGTPATTTLPKEQKTYKTGWQRYAELKRKLRDITLEKDEPGYNSQYFYIPLMDLQKMFTRLEEEHGLTSIYTEETREFCGEINIFAVRKLIDLLPERTMIISTQNIITLTEINITNLKTPKDIYGIGKDVLRIESPKDAKNTLLFDFFEPQSHGAISTYFQRYTYNQLYDFQENKEDKIETKGKTPEEPIKMSKEKKTPKEKRLDNKTLEIQTTIKSEFERADIIECLNGRKLSAMSEKEAKEFYAEMNEKYENKTTKKNEGEL